MDWITKINDALWAYMTSFKTPILEKTVNAFRKVGFSKNMSSSFGA